MQTKGNPSSLLEGMQTGVATMDNTMKCLQIAQMELPFDPVISLLGLRSKNPEKPNQKNLCTPMFIAALFTTAKCWK